MSDLDLLRSLGEQIVPPSLDSLRETARRRTRRTATVTTAVAAVAAAAVVGAVQLVSVERHSAPPPTSPPTVTDTRPLTYAEGTTVHYGDQAVTMAGQVVELDLTDDGVAVRTADNHLWFTDGSAVDEIQAIGSTPEGDDESHGGDYLWGNYVGRVVSASTGSEVAWLQFPPQQQATVTVYNTESGVLTGPYPVEGAHADVGTGLYSVDSGAVYGFTDLTYGESLRPTWRIDLDTGSLKPMYEPEAYQRVLESRGLARTLLISHQATPRVADYAPTEDVQQFSVTGTRVRPEGEQPLSVLDGLTGQELRFDAPPDYPETNPLWLVQWLDDETVVLHAKRPGGVDLLECHISTGECAVAAQASSAAVVPAIG